MGLIKLDNDIKFNKSDINHLLKSLSNKVCILDKNPHY